MKRTIITLALLATPWAASCQSQETKVSDADKAKAYFEDGVACYKRLDFLCSAHLFEQVWYLDDYTKVNEIEWIYYTAQSNYLVAIDDDVIFPMDGRIQAAFRAESLYRNLGAEFDEERLLSQYFVIKSIADPCDERRAKASERFHQISVATSEDDFIEVKALVDELLQDSPDCGE